MCRSKELGGRRCPSHSNPKATAAHNARRRELYAAKRKGLLESHYSFPEITDSIYDLYKGPQAFSKFTTEAAALKEKLFDVSITTNERQEILGAVDGYTSFYNTEVRAYLNDAVQEQKVAERSEKIVDGIEKAFKLAPKVETPRLLYRGLRVPDSIPSEQTANWIADNFPVGGVISQKNYMSTTFSGHVAAEHFGSNNDSFDDDYNERQERESVIFEILSTKGIALGEGVSAWGNGEEEVLIPRESYFKVVSMHSNKLISAQVDEIDVQKVFKKTIIRLIDVRETD